jgi:DNA transposition AAA+ family ATPase
MPKLLKLAPTKNLNRINDAYANLAEGGMGLVFGHPGFGKTWGSCSIYVREKGLLITAKPGWTQKALLKNLLRELGQGEPKGTNADLLDQVIQALAQLRDSYGEVRPIFVDEADHLTGDRRCLETLRSIHDATEVPLLMVGMAGVPGQVGIDTKVKSYPQFADRIAEWIEFQPVDQEDMSLLVRYCTGIKIADDLLMKLLSDSKGNLRQIRTGLRRIEHLARSNRVEVISLSQWGDKEFFLRKGA